jgi:DNA-directed RNA polymerase specialized sigma24 family protein
LKQSNTFDETEIALLLIEGGSQRAEGLRRLDKEYRVRVGAYLRARFPGMRPEDIAECYSDVLIQVIEALGAYDRDAAESSFNPDKPLLPYLLKIAFRRGIDRLRKAKRHEEFIQAVGSALSETDLGRHWKGLTLPERQEIRAEACKAIAKLPPKERLVWGIFLDRFMETGERPSEQELHALVCEKAGPEHTFVSVKRALNNGRVAVRRHLEAKGYRDQGIFGDDP